MAKSPDELSKSSLGVSKPGKRKEKFRLTIFLMIMTLFSPLTPHKISNKQKHTAGTLQLQQHSRYHLSHVALV